MKLVHADEIKDTPGIMKKYRRKSESFLNRQVITQTVMMKDIWKSDSIQMMIYQLTKHYDFMIK